MRSRLELSRLADAMGGLPILGCLDGSPAADAGVRYGDVLLAIDGMPTATWDDFIAARAKTRERFVARLFRDGEEMEVVVEVRRTTRTPLEILDELVSRRVLGGEPDESDPLPDDGPRN